MTARSYTDEDAALVIEMRKEGVSLRKIADDLQLGVSAVRGILAKIESKPKALDLVELQSKIDTLSLAVLKLEQNRRVDEIVTKVITGSIT